MVKHPCRFKATIALALLQLSAQIAAAGVLLDRRAAIIADFGIMRQSVPNTLSMLNNAAVREEIELSDEQARQIETIDKEFSQEFMPEVDRLLEHRRSPGRFAHMSDVERREALQQTERRYIENVNKLERKYEAKLNGVLMPHQTERLLQIRLQASGDSALKHPTVIQALAISDEQRRRLAAIRAKFHRRMELSRGKYGRAPLDGNQRRQVGRMLSELRKKQEAELMAILTDEQRMKLEDLKGKPFDLTQLVSRSSRGGR